MDFFLCIPLNYYNKQYLLTVLSMQHYKTLKHQKGQNSYSRRVSFREEGCGTRPFSHWGTQTVLSVRHGASDCKHDHVKWREGTNFRFWSLSNNCWTVRYCVRPWETGVQKPYSAVIATTCIPDCTLVWSPTAEYSASGWSRRSLLFCLSNPSGVEPGAWPHLHRGFDISLGYTRFLS